jgi:undecaprenyl diphosphate synthase
MRLFMTALQREVGKLVENGVRLRIAGERADFDPELRAAMHTAEARTAHNSRLNLTVCAGYGGRWDIVQALRSAVRAEPQCLTMPERIDEELVGRHLALSFAPDLDLLIRSGGEQRISNFLLWQAAYAELYFTEVLWPDFDAAAFDAALEWYAGRERRFGRTSAQVADAA